MKRFINPKLKMKIRFYLYYLKYWYKIYRQLEVEKTVVILGMHRSGTSLTAGILHKMGVSMGRMLLGPNPSNKKGHYENKIIEELNKDILRVAGGSWDCPPKQQFINDIKHRFDAKIKRIIKLEQEKIWGWKDPRTVLTIELFIPYLSNLHFIVCRRDRDDIAKSLQLRNGSSIKKWRKLAAIYDNRINHILLKYKHCYPFLEVNFNDFFIKPHKTINEIANFLNITITQEQEKRLLDFIDPLIVHSLK